MYKDIPRWAAPKGSGGSGAESDGKKAKKKKKPKGGGGEDDGDGYTPAPSPPLIPAAWPHGTVEVLGHRQLPAASRDEGGVAAAGQRLYEVRFTCDGKSQPGGGEGEKGGGAAGAVSEDFWCSREELLGSEGGASAVLAYEESSGIGRG